MDEDRGTGRTTDQMLQAPFGAHFIWCNTYLHYPSTLAVKHGRGDLKILSPSALDYPELYYGQRLTGVVLDHAARLTDRQLEGLKRLLSLVRPSITDSALASHEQPCDCAVCEDATNTKKAQSVVRDIEKEVYIKGYLAALHDARRAAHYLNVTAVLHSSEGRDHGNARLVLRAVEVEIERLKPKVGVPPAMVI